MRVTDIIVIPACESFLAIVKYLNHILIMLIIFASLTADS